MSSTLLKVKIKKKILKVNSGVEGEKYYGSAVIRQSIYGVQNKFHEDSSKGDGS